MSDVAIKIENLSKQYRLGLVSTGTLSHDLNRWWHQVRGREDPYLKVSETNDRAHKGESEYVWALKDINLEVKQGEVLGIIGKNGAGKSTLLKILSKVTAPTTGAIKYKGRIGSLLEVGTGFHQELTGRENIFLNGAILGMTKAEVHSKLDEIIDFSGVERYIDTPVKRYSSGMMVRLGFAVAAYLEPDILVVDEVLAVGDAEFQKKAVGKMQEVSQKSGRTVLFVSHNMTSVKNLCNRGLLIDKGSIKFQADIGSTVDAYLREQQDNRFADIRTMADRRGNGAMQFVGARLREKDGAQKADFYIGENVLLDVFFERHMSSDAIFSSRVDICINDKNGNVVAWMSTAIYSDNYLADRESVTFDITRLMLNHGYYDLTLYGEINDELSDRVQNVPGFNVLFNDYYNTGKEILSGQCSLVLDFEVK